MHNVVRKLGLLALVLYGPGGDATYATQQEPDSITFVRDAAENESSGVSMTPAPAPQFIVEYPLQSILTQRFPRSPFDRQHTANRKRYSAVWNVNKGKLFLTKFVAKIDGKPAEISSVVPDKKLPVFAYWYTGKIHVLTSLPNYDSDARHPYYGRVFPRVRVLDVEKGVVISDIEKVNYKIMNPADMALERTSNPAQKCE